jgi:hypothetical protein
LILVRKLFLVVALAFLVAGVSAAASDAWDADVSSMHAGESIFLSNGYRIDLLSVSANGVKVQVVDGAYNVLGSTQVAFGPISVPTWCIEATVYPAETAGAVKAQARATCNQKNFAKVSGTGWLRASAETGSIQISDATGTMTIHGRGSITVKGDALTRGYGYGFKKNSDNSVTYSGDGMVVVKGTNLYISSTAVNVDLYAQGTGSVKLTGKGEYKVGTKATAPYSISSTGSSTTLNGKGWLKAAGSGYVSVDNGNGVFVITGSGWIRIKDSAGDSSRVVAGFGSVKKETDGSITYNGFGTVFVKGTSLKLEASGSDVDLYAKGSGSVYLKGTGTFDASGASPFPPIPIPSVSPIPNASTTPTTPFKISEAKYDSVNARLQATTTKASVCVFGYTAGARTYEMPCISTACTQHRKTLTLTQTAYITCTAKEGSGTDSTTVIISASPACTDSDKGIVPSVKGTCMDSTGSYPDYEIDPVYIREYYCYANTRCVSAKYNCIGNGYANVKADGTCARLTVSANDATATTATVALCVDSDGGKNYYRKGTVTKPFETSKTDLCTGGKLTEYVCSNGNIRSVGPIFCLNGCSNGACNAVGTQTTATANTQSPAITTRITSKEADVGSIGQDIVNWFKKMFEMPG